MKHQDRLLIGCFDWDKPHVGPCHRFAYRLGIRRVILVALDKVPLICAGTDLARQALLTDAQLAERFEAIHLKRWSNTQQLAQLLASLGSILPLREPSQLGTAAVRCKVLDMTDGVTVRIFRLIETVAVEAVRNGNEKITLESFDADNLVLPLVAMARRTEGRLRRHASS